MNINANYESWWVFLFLTVGGFAKVKLARHLLTGEQVAIKIMDKLTLGVSF